MDLASLLFWIIAIILVGSALLVVSLRNIVHSALALIVVFAMAAGIYLLLNAEFIAIVQILIYAGAVTILILFALMLTRTNNIAENSNPNNRRWWAAIPICTLIGLGIIFAVTFSLTLAQRIQAMVQVNCRPMSTTLPASVSCSTVPLPIVMYCHLKLRLLSCW